MKAGRTRRHCCLSLRLGAIAPFVALLGCADNPPHAQFGQPWIPFVITEAMAGAYDPVTLRFRGDTADVRLLFRHVKPMPLPDDSGDVFSFVHAVERVHCPSQHIQDLRMWLGETATDSLNGYTEQSPTWVPFSEHSMSSRILSRLCEALTARLRRGGA